jgi:hypothetical protein
VAGDGGTCAFGDSGFYGSIGGQDLNQTVVGICGNSATSGYRLVDVLGKVYCYDTTDFGSHEAQRDRNARPRAKSTVGWTYSNDVFRPKSRARVRRSIGAARSGDTLAEGPRGPPGGRREADMATTRTRWVAGTSTSPASTAGGSGNPVLAAYQKTVSTKTASVAMDVTVTGASSSPVKVTVIGQVGFSTGEAAFQMAIPSIGSMGVRLVKPTVYVQFPPGLGVPLPAGKSWMSFNLDSPAMNTALGASFSQLTDSANQTTDSLSYLKAVSANGVSTVGTASVRGVPTTEYSATVDLTKAGQGRNPAVQALLQKLQTKTGMTSLPINVWLDDQGQIRREVFDESLTVSGKHTRVQVSVEYFDFGAPIDVAPPPASQTVDLSSVLGSLPGSTSSSVP